MTSVREGRLPSTSPHQQHRSPPSRLPPVRPPHHPPRYSEVVRFDTSSSSREERSSHYHRAAQQQLQRQQQRILTDLQGFLCFVIVGHTVLLLLQFITVAVIQYSVSQVNKHCHPN